MASGESLPFPQRPGHLRGPDFQVDELYSPWQEGAKMKFRVDIVAEKGQPAPGQPLLVRYFDVSDMDEIEESINSYRKRLIFTAQEKLTERYEVSAFLVQTQ